MELLVILIGFIMLVCVAIVYYRLGFYKAQEEVKKETRIYVKKDFMTKAELQFYNKIIELESEYKIVPQINLATIIKKLNKGYINELFKNIDFAIFDKEYKNILLLIELNDETHYKIDRKDRDLKVKKICDDANIKLITFYTRYPNDKEYVLNRIREQLINLDDKTNI